MKAGKGVRGCMRTCKSVQRRARAWEDVQVHRGSVSACEALQEPARACEGM